MDLYNKGYIKSQCNNKDSFIRKHLASALNLGNRNVHKCCVNHFFTKFTYIHELDQVTVRVMFCSSLRLNNSKLLTAFVCE